jgi:hypothetical protein
MGRGIAALGLLLLGGLLMATEPAGATYRYDRTGRYLDYASRPHLLHEPSLNGSTLRIDSQGILMTLTTGEQIRSGAEDAAYGLVEWSKYVRGGPHEYLARAKRAAVWLAQKQDEAGLFHYDYERDLGGPGRPLVLHRGWYGALAQGMTASLGSRLYRLTGKRFYLRLARRAIEPFTRMMNQDGVQSRFLGTDRVFFEGYGTLPVAVHTLNHFMYSLVGLYDMADLSPIARGLFRRGLRTLTEALPYYDVVGPDGRPRSAPWLAQLTDPPRPAYTLQGFLQEQEVAILRALSSLRPKLKILRTYERRYLRQLSWICQSPAELCQFAH